MIEKKWLIRTFDKKILGPVTRDKLLCLLRDNKLSDSDEICPGNHYWVYVKEKKIISALLDAPEIMEAIGVNDSVSDIEEMEAPNSTAPSGKIDNKLEEKKKT